MTAGPPGPTAGDDRPAGGPGILAIAHRGEPVAHRENTLPAIRAALDAGADIVEIDVKTTADGVSVVLHDDSLSRLWDLDRDIRELTAAEVAAVGAAAVDGDQPHVEQRIPTLEQVLRLFTGARAAVLVDMDSGAYAAAARQVVQQAVAAGQLRATQVIWCGDLDGMREVRAADAEARIFLSWGEEARSGPPPDDLVETLRPEAFNPHWAFVERGGREWAREHDLALSCWTVDDASDMARLAAAGVDAIISNRIGRLLEVVRRQR